MFRRPIPSLLVAASLGTGDTTEPPEIYDIDQDVVCDGPQTSAVNDNLSWPALSRIRDHERSDRREHHHGSMDRPVRRHQDTSRHRVHRHRRRGCVVFAADALPARMEENCRYKQVLQRAYSFNSRYSARRARMIPPYRSSFDGREALGPYSPPRYPAPGPAGPTQSSGTRPPAHPILPRDRGPARPLRQVMPVTGSRSPRDAPSARACRLWMAPGPG